MLGCLIPDLDTGPQPSFSAILIMRLIAITNKITETVYPVTIPFSNRWYFVLNVPVVFVYLFI